MELLTVCWFKRIEGHIVVVKADGKDGSAVVIAVVCNLLHRPCPGVDGVRNEETVHADLSGCV